MARGDDKSRKKTEGESEPGGDLGFELAPAMVTGTMAEIYLQQGHTAQALAIYRKLAARSPDDRELRRKVTTLEQRLDDERARGAKLEVIDRLKRILRKVTRRRRLLEAKSREAQARKQGGAA